MVNSVKIPPGKKEKSTVYPNTAFAQVNTLSRKARGPFGLDHVQLTLYGPSGASSHFYLSVDQARQLITSLSLALGDLAEKRALEVATS